MRSDEECDSGSAGGKKKGQRENRYQLEKLVSNKKELRILIP